jgi:radical SAM superfamily enzyme YgiQ (UPF0313 family)
VTDMKRVGRKSRSDLIVCLISPPAYYPWSVPPGIAYLAGYLLEHGIRVRTIDANVEALEHVLTQRASEPQRTRAAFATLRDMATLRDWRTYEESMGVLSIVAKGLSSTSEERLTFERNTLRYFPAFERRSRKGLIAAALAPERHLFTDYYRDVLAPTILRERPDIIGVSASDLHQLLPATVMAAVLRRMVGNRCPPMVFGGNVFSRIHDILQIDDADNRALFAIWGTVIVGEGERGLVQFVEKLGTSCTADVDGNLTPGRSLQKAPAIDLELIATPHCDGFKPLSPQLPVPLNIFRGCYFSGICQFCDINHGYDTVWTAPDRTLPQTAHRRRALDRVIQDIRTAMSRYGTTLFSFTDEWFPARDMLHFADRLVNEGIQIQWDAYARFEPALADPQTADKLARAGLRFLQFGLETASASTLQLVKKGITADLSERVLKTTAAAGIWNHVFVIVGLPGEALHDTLFTISFLKKNAEHLLTIKPTRFRLSRWSPLARRPSELLSVNLCLASERDLSLDLPFHYGRGTKQTVERDRVGENGKPRDGVKLSHRAVNAMYGVLEALVSEHWAYGFTSLYPYHTRLLFSPNDARAIAKARGGGSAQRLSAEPLDTGAMFSAVGRYLRSEAVQVPRIRRLYEQRGLDSAPVDGDWSRMWQFADTWCAAPASSLPGPREESGESNRVTRELVFVRR